MRVIGGQWRGRRLNAPRGDAVRPTTDRVKEAVFSILGDRVEGAVVLDLCCGAGGLGIEALSRGAARAATWQLVQAQAPAWLAAWRPPDAPWLLLADPPYATDVAAALVPAVEALARHPRFRCAVLETGVRSPALPGGLCTRDERRYGETVITILEPAEAWRREDP